MTLTEIQIVDQVIAEQKLEEEKKRLERRLQRIKDCGKYAWWFDQHSGDRAGYIRYCDNFRECQTCLERRAKQEYEWMKLKVYQGETEMVVTTAPNKEEATKMVRGVHKSKYVRYPQENGTEILFFDKTTEKVGEVVDPDWLRAHSDKWIEWLLTPEGRNKSGTMHVPAQPAEEKKFTIITTKQFIADAPENVVAEVMDNIAAETAEMNPQTPEEVEECLDIRFMKATAEIVKLGFAIRIYSKHLKTYHDEIDWQKSRIKFNGVNTKNLTSKMAIPPPR